MNKVFAIIRREFVERVRTRVFVVATIGFPLLMVGLMFIPALLISKSSSVKRVAIIDAAEGDFGARIESALSAGRSGGDGEASAFMDVVRIPARGRLAQVRDSLLTVTGIDRKEAATQGIERFDGLLLLSEETIASGKVDYLGSNAGSPTDMRTLQNRIRPLLVGERLQRAGVDPSVVGRAMGSVELVTSKVVNGKLTGESGQASYILGYAMGMLIYFGLLFYGVQVMSSIVEEKSTRVVEILASSLTPYQMMLGKVLGVGSAGLFQMGIWAGTATLLTMYKVQVGGLLGVSPEAMAGFSVPAVSPALLGVFLLFFVLGFLMFSAMYAAIGAMCSTQQDVQQVQLPVTLVVILGFFSVFSVLNDPNASLGQTLSLVPLVTPFVVPVRYSITPLPLTQVGISAGITLVFMLFVVWVASRIYRVGILSYGKRASIKDVWRWLRAR